MPDFDTEGAVGAPRPAGPAPLERGMRPEEGEQQTGPAGGGRQPAGPGGMDHLQQTAGNAAVGSLLAPRTPGDMVRSVVGGGGRPLDGAAGSFVRSAGYDPSAIRVHEGPEAAGAARSVDADMFASGNHLVAPKGLDVTTREGAFKTVHEVHHIVSQQAKGPVDGTETGDGLKISDPSDRFEREADGAAADAVAEHFDR